jgi:hypothetical protein
MFGEKLDADIARILKSHKEMWVNTTERGDLFPTTIVIRGGQIIAVIVAQQVDKNLGLKAARMARTSFSADALVLACDAHCYVADSEKGYEEAKATWPDGLMQKACDDHGACNTDKRMSDCLSVVLAHENGSIEIQSMTYDYHGKNGGVPFKWTEHPGKDAMKNSDGTKLGGYMVNNMLAIMKMPKTDDLLNMLGNLCGMNDPAKIRFSSDMAAAAALESFGFITMFQIQPDRAHMFLERKCIDQDTYDKIMATKDQS